MAKLPPFATKIKRLRAKTKLSQTGFAELLRISVRTLEGWECGRFTPDYHELILEGIKAQLAKRKP